LLKKALVLISLLIVVNSCNQKPPEENKNELFSRLDSILTLKNIENIERNDYLKSILEEAGSDSLKNKLLLEISYFHIRENDVEQFKFWNEKSRKHSIKIHDSVGIANTYWDAAHFYKLQDLPDSTFFMYTKAYGIFERINQSNEAARLLLNMAVIESEIGDYTGSEISIAKALILLKNSGKNKWLYDAHNNLGIVYDGIAEYEKSHHHYNLALNYFEKIANKNKYQYKSSVYNNIGVLFLHQGKYKEAVDYFDLTLSKDSLSYKNPKLYAIALSNKAYSKLQLEDTLGILNSFTRALKIRDSIENQSGIITSKIHLSQFYAFKEDTARAIKLANESKILASENLDNKNHLASLKLLSDFDKKNSKIYLDEYIKLSDSLQQAERSTRNKFTKIKYDTEEYIAKNEELSEQRNLLIGISLAIALLGLSGFVIKIQRTRNRELVLNQEHQEANGKVLKLLLNQKNIKEEARQKERIRLSEEIHDGILSKLFGLRLSLSSLNSKSDRTSIEQREEYLNDLKLLSNELRQLSHELSSPLFSAEMGYEAILEEVLSHQNENTFSYDLNIDRDIEWESISGSIKLHLLRILQEAIKNIRKHSRAEKVQVSISYRNEFIVFKIRDDGTGFDMAKITEGIGLRNIKSRTNKLKGKFHMESNNNGTEILIKFPV
jgi:signal transduction histidine kinase